MEEDIKILEKLVNLTFDQELLYTLKEVNEDDEVPILSMHEKEAIENLIKDHKNQKEKNDALFELCNERFKEIAELERQLKIKNQYLGLIHNIGFDYDGFDTVESLKSLIDELVDYAVKAIKNDDKYVVYQGGNGKHFNILQEEIENDNHIPHID